MGAKSVSFHSNVPNGWYSLSKSQSSVYTMENLFEELDFTLENIGYHLQESDSKIAEGGSTMSL